MSSLMEFPWVATILAAAGACGLGVFWYHPKVLGARWMDARGKAMVPGMSPSPRSILYTFLLWMIASAFYSFLTLLLNADSAAALVGLACLLWVAFAMPPRVMGSLYTGYSFNAVAIDMGYQLAGYYLFALVHIAALATNSPLF
jgi:hypothetical protein